MGPQSSWGDQKDLWGYCAFEREHRDPQPLGLRSEPVQHRRDDRDPDNPGDKNP